MTFCTEYVVDYIHVCGKGAQHNNKDLVHRKRKHIWWISLE